MLNCVGESSTVLGRLNCVGESSTVLGRLNCVGESSTALGRVAERGTVTERVHIRTVVGVQCGPHLQISQP